MRYFIFISLISILVSQVPYQYQYSQNLNRFDAISVKGSTASNVIVDIQQLEDSLYLFGTGTGLSFGELSSDGSIDFGYFSLSEMPRGGNPALAIFENIIAVSGVIDTNVVTGTEPKGTGIAYSKDRGNNWEYLPQPVDPDTVYFENLSQESCILNDYDWDTTDNICFSNKYWKIPWGEQEVKSLLASSEVNNVTYDLSVSDDYIYAASWAGGIRRYPLKSQVDSEPKSWEIIILPRDDDLELYCSGELDSTYTLNPRDPGDGGNHNHKGFSVYVKDNIIWAGTAAGINKGIINGDCIDWVGHFTSWLNNISGNWVIGFTYQLLDDVSERLWAITWAGEGNSEKHALSYTDDGGENWHITFPSGHSEKVYNLYANESRIWAASESGLYVSEDGEHWEKYSRPVNYNTEEELLTQPVFSVYTDENNWLLLGTSDGIALSNDDGINWIIHRFWQAADHSDRDNVLSAYPNPFLINDYNIVGNDGHVRFVYSNPNKYPGKMDIFDFSMDKVIHLNNSNLISLDGENEMIWNGRNEYNDKVANGVYFCRLSLNGEYYWTKLAVIN